MNKTVKIQALRQTALRLRWMALAGAWGAPCLLVLALLDSDGGNWVTLTGTEGMAHWLAAAIAALITALLVAALLQLARMLTFVEGGEFFSPGAIHHFHRFARLLLMAAVAGPLLPPIAQLATAAIERRGEVSLTITGNDMLWLFLALVFYLVARLLEQAAHYEADSRSIV